ncbi:MAG: acetoacetate--CoA ligase, partial [Planctomycetota bacterium]
MPAPLWIPDPDCVARARITAFLLGLPESSAPGWSYEDLHAWSVRNPEAFWSSVWEACGVQGEKGARVLLDGSRMPGARWFPEARLSFAENILRRRDDQPAILFRREDGLRRSLTFAQLHEEVARLQAAFRNSGLKAGDRVAAILPNIPEAVAAMLAVASLGGIWSSCSPDFGVEGVLDRFGQIEPRFLLAVDGYLYKGRRFDCMERLAQITARLPGLEKTLILPYSGASLDLGGLPRALDWRHFLESAPPRPLTLERFPFDQPLYILFSSGTTGKPKCIVHGAGGTLLQHLKEHQLHTDLGPGDRLFYFTTTGWMMWNWLVSALASGSTIVLYDGNPFHPGPRALWDLVEQEKITVFGTSAKYLDAVKNAGLEPRNSHHLESLRAILSTGSPLVPEGFDFVYEKVKDDLQLASISGGTDLISCFALGCPILPVFRGEIQCRGLGMKVEVWNQDGVPVVGKPGELVCTGPFPSMPVRFWNDPGGKRYRAAYFEHFPGVWRHGDL